MSLHVRLSSLFLVFFLVQVDTTLRSPLAKTPSARKVLVEQCELLLGSTHCDPINAARFFINLATGAAQQHFTLAERIVILGIASKCLHLLETDAARRLFTVRFTAWHLT